MGLFGSRLAVFHAVATHGDFGRRGPARLSARPSLTRVKMQI